MKNSWTFVVIRVEDFLTYNYHVMFHLIFHYFESLLELSWKNAILDCAYSG